MPCIFGSALTMQEAVALCLKQYPLLNPDRSKNASTAFAYLKRKRKNIRSKSTQTGKSQQCCDSWCCTNSLKHMENNNTNNKSKEMGCISLPECIPSCSSQLKSFQVLGRHRFELKSLPFLWTWVRVNVCAWERLRGGLAVAVIQVAAAFVAGTVGASARAPFLFFFFLFLVRSVKAEASAAGGWAGGGKIEKLWLGSACTKRIISEGILGYQTSECGLTIFNRAYNSGSFLVMR